MRVTTDTSWIMVRVQELDTNTGTLVKCNEIYSDPTINPAFVNLKFIF